MPTKTKKKKTRKSSWIEDGTSTNGQKKRRMKTLEDWPAWSTHLSERTRPVPIPKLVESGKKSPLRWALPQAMDQATIELIQWLDRLGSNRRARQETAERLEQWLDQPRDRQLEVNAAYECLAWSHALPSLSEHLPAGPWWQLLDRLLEVAAGEDAPNPCGEGPLVEQLLAGELPLTLAYLFPELDRCRKLADPAGDTIATGIDDLLDEKGWLKAGHLEDLRPLMACWLRSSWLDRELELGRITGDAALQFDWLVRQAIRITRPDGSQMLCNGSTDLGIKRLFESALRLTGDLDDRAIAGRALSNGASTSDKHRATDLPKPDAHSEWAEVAVLRSSWARSSNRLLVTYGRRQLESELCSGRSVIWSGNCDPQIEIDGQSLSPSADWQEVCWHVDDDVSYLELECELGAVWKIQRQWLLARQHRFLYVADAVVSDRAAADKIEYRCTWPLAGDVRFDGEAETREGFLGGEKPLARAIPLALPEWRTERIESSLANVDGGLQLFQTGRGRALHAPLFVDLNSRRLDKPLTWRRLTIAEQLEVQPPDVAAGYRVQVGKSQWLIYRSLTPPASRTVLGQNLLTEFYVARFNKSGDTEELLEIE